jgi:hypothetical protein
MGGTRPVSDIRCPRLAARERTFADRNRQTVAEADQVRWRVRNDVAKHRVNSSGFALDFDHINRGSAPGTSVEF